MCSFRCSCSSILSKTVLQYNVWVIPWGGCGGCTCMCVCKSWLWTCTELEEKSRCLALLLCLFIWDRVSDNPGARLAARKNQGSSCLHLQQCWGYRNVCDHGQLFNVNVGNPNAVPQVLSFTEPSFQPHVIYSNLLYLVLHKVGAPSLPSTEKIWTLSTDKL